MTLTPPPPDPSNAFADDAAAAALGQQLFFDSGYAGPLIIGDNGTNGALGSAGQQGKVSCASCHDPAQAGTDHRSAGPTSLGAGWTGRNAPTVLDAAVTTAPWVFWDGRKDSLWSQALGPIEGAVEINSSRLRIAHYVFARYRAAYEAIFGPLPDLSDAVRFPAQGKPGDAAFEQMAPGDQAAVNRAYANVGKAIEAYERKLIDTDSPFDRYLRGDTSALSASAVRGAKLFVGRAACNECHDGPALSDGKFHNHGIPQIGSGVPAVDNGRADGIPELLGDPFNRAGAFSDSVDSSHLAGLAVQDQDRGAFKTPTLRNVSRTAPYMHTGSFRTLWDVLVWYRDAAGTDGYVGTRNAAVQPLRLSDADLNDLVAFLKSLDGAPLPTALVTAP